MAILARTKKVKLSFFEDKPERYKLQQIKFPAIKEDALIAYISNSAAVPRSTVKACVEAISEAIVYFVINGHRVSFQNFGSFGLKTRAKAVRTMDECTLSTLKRISINFQPVQDITDLVHNTSIEMASGSQTAVGGETDYHSA
jgi:nucleoid DNA-binding protein